MRHRFFSLTAITLILALSFTVLPGCCCPFYNTYRDLEKLVPVGTVSGTVFAGDPKQPVSGATVTIADQSTTTDSSGQFKLTKVVAANQTITVVSGDLSWTGTVQVTQDGDVSLPEIILSAAPEAYPATPEDLIRAYYKAVNERNYVRARGFCSGQVQPSVATLQAQYGDYIKSVSVAGIERQANRDYDGRSIYEVTFTAEYIKHYPAGNGDLPTSHALKEIEGRWKIVDIGTG